jgi:hypothetical protein
MRQCRLFNGRKGPTSFPLGLITPIVPATIKKSRLCVEAKAMPAPGKLLEKMENEAAA